MRSWAFVVAAFTFLSAVLAHRVEIEPSTKQCFYEDLNVGDQVCKENSTDI